MLNIVVASKNPVKMNAAREGFLKMFPEKEVTVEGVSVPSGVSDQPMTSEETLKGAMNRAATALEAAPGCEYAVRIEGGVEMHGEDLAAFAWIVVKHRSGRVGKSRTQVYYMPPQVKELVLGGMELGVADDVVFQRSGSKTEGGALGLLTSDIITRTSCYADSVVLALIPEKNLHLYA